MPSDLSTALETYQGNSIAQLDASEGILVKLLGNVLKDPSDEKKRSVRLSNEKIHSAVVAPRGDVRGCVVRAATGVAVGGGVFNNGGTLTAHHTSISGNTAIALLGMASGGGLQNHGVRTHRCTKSWWETIAKPSSAVWDEWVEHLHTDVMARQVLAVEFAMHKDQLLSKATYLPTPAPIPPSAPRATRSYPHVAHSLFRKAILPQLLTGF